MPDENIKVFSNFTILSLIFDILVSTKISLLIGFILTVLTDVLGFFADLKPKTL